MSEEKKNAIELDDQALNKVAGGDGRHSDDEPYIEQDICIKCGDCVKVCMTGAIHVVNGLYQIDPGACNLCRFCAHECIMGATWIPRY